MTYDLALLNATVVDGTGRAAVVTDVAISGDRVARVGPLDDGARAVRDLHGRVVTPGFVDLHSHSDYSLHADPLARSKLHQGVTTEVGGNCGYHAAPLAGGIADDRRREYRHSMGLDVSWSTSAEYRVALAAAAPSVNYAQQIGYNSLLSTVSGDRNERLSPAQRERLRGMVRDEFAAGAVGLSYGLAYSPACFSSTDELVDVAEEAAAVGRVISFHLRNEDFGLLEALDEALLVARRSGAPCHIGHLKTFRRPNWHKLDDVFARLQAATDAGIDLTVDRYPHLAMNTQLKFILPIWTLEGGIEATKARLRDPDTKAKIVAELHRTIAGEASEVMISLVAHAAHKPIEGLFLDQAAAGQDPFAYVCDLLAVEGEAAFATFFGMSTANLDRILALPTAVVASDASVQAVHRQAGGGRPHPRCFDTFAYFLAEWVYARGVLTLPEAVRRITSLPARVARLDDRGTLTEGAYADLTVIDLALLEARTSYDAPMKLPPAVTDVIVNGVPVLVDGVHTLARPGRYLTAGRGAASRGHGR